MAEFTSYTPGTPCWIDLATTDPGAAKTFYAGIFGWEYRDMPSGMGPYTMYLMKGRPVAGMFGMSAEMMAGGKPPFWMSYVAVSDVDASAARAADLGGTVLSGPVDAMDAGRMATIQDPTGAVFALWQAGTHFGAGLANEPGSLSWNELQTHDTEAAAAFYERLLGWKPETSDMPGGPYTSFNIDGKPVAGMMAIRPEWGEVPPNWSIYLTVEDCDAAIAKATEMGGSMQTEPMDIPGVGRFALLQDPQGAHFFAMAMAMAE